MQLSWICLTYKFLLRGWVEGLKTSKLRTEAEFRTDVHSHLGFTLASPIDLVD